MEQEISCETPNRPYLVGYNPDIKKCIMLQPDCGSWSCEACAQKRAKWWLHTALKGFTTLSDAGNTISFLTLTARPHLTREGTILSFVTAWPKLRKRINRKSGNFQYLAIPELHKSGKMHVHVIGTASVSRHWLHDASHASGLGYQADTVPLTDGQACGFYVTKYLAKSLSVAVWPRNFRRVRKSRAWPTIPAHIPPVGWEWLTFTQKELAEYEVGAMQEAGYVALVATPSDATILISPDYSED